MYRSIFQYKAEIFFLGHCPWNKPSINGGSPPPPGPRRDDPVAQRFQLGPLRMEAFVRRPDEQMQREVYKAGALEIQRGMASMGYVVCVYK